MIGYLNISNFVFISKVDFRVNAEKPPTKIPDSDLEYKINDYC